MNTIKGYFITWIYFDGYNNLKSYEHSYPVTVDYSINYEIWGTEVNQENKP